MPKVSRNLWLVCVHSRESQDNQGHLLFTSVVPIEFFEAISIGFVQDALSRTSKNKEPVTEDLLLEVK